MTQPFGGQIGRTWRDSEPWWPPEPQPPEGAPNVVLVVLDDVGFAQLGCYGSEVETPVLDGLAAEGVQLANFHTTSLCSPTRSCLLTGRNHHTNGMGRITDLSIGFPGYNARIPKTNGFLGEILAPHGYVNVAVGKWHLTPEDETHQAAPRRTWPCSRGFQRWYGFHGGETHQFVPSLFQDQHSVVPPRSPADGYHLTEDLAARAVQYLGEVRSAAPDSPFFLYLATGACHSPHQAPPEWIERYAGRFDSGWDSLRERIFDRQMAMGLFPAGTRLSPRPHWVPAWDDLEPEDQRVAARFMECFAGFLSHADAQIGRVFDFIRSIGEWSNTLVVAVSDNGASAEGGPLGSLNDVRLWNVAMADATELRARIDELGTETAHNNYPWGWTMAGNTPFRRWKREVHQGGVADPCLISWPARIPAGTGPRRQFAHAIDIVPTILDLVGIEAPAEIEGVAQTPIEGVPLSAVLKDPGAAETHGVQYFEMFGSRGLYMDGWKAVTFHPFVDLYQEGRNPDQDYDDDTWELYHVAVDPSETTDLAGAEPERVAAMDARWWEEAAKYNVLPVDHRLIDALMDPRRSPVSRATHRVHPFGAILPEYRVTPLRSRAHSVVAEVEVPPGGAEGVILAMGTVLGGWSFQAYQGRIRYVHNFVGAEIDIVTANSVLPLGRHRVGFAFTPADGPGAPDAAATVTLTLDGVDVGSGGLRRVPISRFNLTGGGLTCGWEQGPAVGPDYRAPFRFTGTLAEVVLTTDVDGGDPARAVFADLDAILAEQ